jgi:hypothetical protein
VLEEDAQKHGDGRFVLALAFDQRRFLPLNLSGQLERQCEGGCAKK